MEKNETGNPTRSNPDITVNSRLGEVRRRSIDKWLQGVRKHT
jgi:hypothetical protein